MWFDAVGVVAKRDEGGFRSLAYLALAANVCAILSEL